MLTVVVWLPAARPAKNALKIVPARAKPGHLAQRHYQPAAIVTARMLTQ